MVFCCIAIVGIAMIWFGMLWLRHLFSGPRRDKTSALPVPPRALTGNGAMPVYGHTRLFKKMGADIALLFPWDMREWRWLPNFCSRQLGDCFSIFIWGQWRVVIRGPKRTSVILDSVGLQQGWAWSPPKPLLGSSCLPLLSESEAEFLTSLIRKPLSHESVVLLAPDFAESAEKIVDSILAREHKKDERKEKDLNPNSSNEFVGGDEEACWNPGPKNRKLEWDTLRAYTLELIDGPVLNLDVWKRGEESNETLPWEGLLEKSEKTGRFARRKKPPPSRDLVLLWMERVKDAMLVIKMTWGAEWAQVWRMNQYGRAINGRMHLEKILSRHIAKQQQLVPVPRERGYSFQEPMASPFPWITYAENMYFNYRKNQITSSSGKISLQGRPRSLSAPEVLQEVNEETYEFSRYCDIPPPPSNPRPLEKEQDLHHAEYVASPATSSKSGGRERSESESSPVRGGRKEMSREKNDGQHIPKETTKKRRVVSILEQFLQQKDSDGTGMTQVVVTETCFLLWMMMDAGNVWTAMALHLLSNDHAACRQVQEELDHLVAVYGKDKLYVPSVLNRMKALDAVLYEAIRLCPPFLGGMKKTSQTVELPEVGLQIPKNTNVIFCQPTEGPFDMSAAWGQKPQNLGMCYPSLALNGFLAFQGMEVPVMVLQSKVFLAVLLQRFSPYLSKKRTFIRKVKEKLTRQHEQKSGSVNTELNDFFSNDEADDLSHHDVNETVDGQSGNHQHEMTQTEAMRLFTKIPFPEPRRVLNVRVRDEASCSHHS